jgi:hypothetical protein
LDLASITGECWIANATFVNGTRASSMFIIPEDDYAVGALLMTRIAYINGTVSASLYLRHNWSLTSHSSKPNSGPN